MLEATEFCSLLIASNYLMFHERLWLLVVVIVYFVYTNSDCLTHEDFVGFYLQGVPFRTSHDIAGRSVAMCVSKNCQLSDLSLGEMQTISPVIEKDVYDYLGVENAIKKFSSYGSTGSECVASQVDYWIGKLDINRDKLL